MDYSTQPPPDDLPPLPLNMMDKITSNAEPISKIIRDKTAFVHCATSDQKKQPSQLASSANSTTSSIHAFSKAEKVAFVKHINTVLASVPELQDKLPIDPETDQIFRAISDGILLCKLINASVPKTIDESRLVKGFRDEKSRVYHMINNHNLCIEGARKIGAVVVNLGAEDLLAGKTYLVFGLLWQIIKIGMLHNISLAKHPELASMKEGEEDLENLPPEELLLKWVNWHLKQAGVQHRLHNFSSDVNDSIAYIHLMHQLSPSECTLDALDEPNALKRADMMLMNAEKLGCRSFVSAEDVTQGNEKLNLVFTASMFNKHVGIAPIAAEETMSLRKRIEELEAQLKERDFAYESTIAHQQQLEEELFALRLEKADLATNVLTLTEKLEQLSNSERKSLDEKSLLEQSLQDLDRKFRSLNTELVQTSEELQKERISLETSEFCGASLANDLELLRSRQEKLEFLIEHLKVERMRSDMHVERLKILYNSFPSTEALCEAIYGPLTLETVRIGAQKAGYLTKKARNGSTWKYRYFVLRDNFLFYFRTDKESSATANGVIRVDDAQLKFAENPTKKDLKDQWLLAIEVPNNNDIIKKAIFYISGEDSELESWRFLINQAAGWWTKQSRVRLSQ